MPVITATEYLEIAGVPLATPAWRIVDLSAMFIGPALRGTDRLIPAAAGVKPYRRRATVTTKPFPMVIFGAKNQEGVANANVRVGLLTNIEYLRTNVIDPLATGNGTRTVIWRRADGTTRTAQAHVLPLELGPLGPTAVRAVLTLSIPTGVFT